MRTALLLPFLFVSGTIVSAHDERPAAHVMAPAQAEIGAEAAFAADGVLWAVHRVSGHVAVSRSADEGRSWSNPVLVTRAPEPIDPGGDARPKIAIGSRGEIYVTWTKPLAEPYTGEIRLARSLDGGRTFSPPLVVHCDRQVIAHRFDAVVVDNRGRVFVAWIDKRDVGASGANGYRGAALYFAVSDNQGASFHGDYKVADHCCECCRIALAAKPSGGVAVFWRHIFAPNIRDHALATLYADGHTSDVQRVTFEDWRIDACPHHGPALAVDDAGQPHGVWFSAAAGHRGIFYGRLSGDRLEAHGIGDATAGHPDIAVNGQEIAIAWKEIRDSHTRLCATISHDGGATWRDCGELASIAGAADHPRVLWRSHQFVVFWSSAERPLAVIPLAN